MAPFNPIGHSLDNAHVKDLKLGGLRLRDIPGPVIVAIGAALLLARFTGRPMIAVTGVTGPIGASVVQALDKDRKLRVCGGAMKERVWEKWVLFKREFDFFFFFFLKLSTFKDAMRIIGMLIRNAKWTPKRN